MVLLCSQTVKIRNIVALHMRDTMRLACFDFYSGLSLFLTSILAFPPFCEVGGAGEKKKARKEAKKTGQRAEEFFLALLPVLLLP